MILRIILIVLAIIVLAVAALILLLTVFPLRFTFEYKEPGFLIQLRAGPFRFTLLRRETPEQKAERERKKAEKEAQKRKKKESKPPPNPEEKKRRRKDIPKLIQKALEEFTRKGKIPLDKFWLDVTFGGSDPASAAMLFGGAHAALGALWPLAEAWLEIRDRRIRTAVDFNLSSTRVDYFCAVLPLPLAKGLSVGIRVLIWMIRERRRTEGPEKAGETKTPKEQKEAV